MIVSAIFFLLVTSGNFSPVHTRRRIQSEDVSKVLPDFAEFPISRKCPKLVAELGTEVRDVEAELLDLVTVIDFHTLA